MPETAAMLKHPADTLEMQEYLYASTLAEKTAREQPLPAPQAVALAERLREEIRRVLHLHRFACFTFLAVNDVAIPAPLIADQAHPEVGRQTPDQPVPEAFRFRS